MAIELDHVFVLTEAGAPEADLMAEVGLVEGESNTHPGQGTANRRFFFGNTMLEFLYVHDADEADNGPARRLRFQDRNSQASASPFGLIMRAVNSQPGNPFPGWKYCPDYFADDVCFHVGENSDVLEEPLCICMPNNLPQRKQKPAPENAGWILTELRINVPVVTLSEPLREISLCQNIAVNSSMPHAMELTFNNSAEKKRKVFEFDMPLIFNW